MKVKQRAHLKTIFCRSGIVAILYSPLNVELPRFLETCRIVRDIFKDFGRILSFKQTLIIQRNQFLGIDYR